MTGGQRRLALDYAGENYLDRTEPLRVGDVRPRGVDLSFSVEPVLGLFRKMIRSGAYAASEMSMSYLLGLVAAGDDRLRAIPVFPARSFRHRDVYLSVTADVVVPQDLAGKRVGVPEYGMTTAVWVRGVLQHDYGVEPETITWSYGGLDRPEQGEPMLPAASCTVPLAPVPAGRSLNAMLLDGSLDAVIASQAPQGFRDGTGRVRRLFANYRKVESEYFTRTGMFPIMHTVVLRADVYEAHPWVAGSLFDAFVDARRVSLERLTDLDVATVGHPWWQDEVATLRELFGGDAYPYGLARNYDVLERMCQYSFEQGLSERLVRPEELFCEVLEPAQCAKAGDEKATP